MAAPLPRFPAPSPPFHQVSMAVIHGGGDEDNSKLVQVRFITKLDDPLKVPPTSIAIPSNFDRYTLSSLVNDLLRQVSDEWSYEVFDFLIDGELLRLSLEEFLLAKGISAEKDLEIEYIKAAVPRKQDQPCPHDDWVSAVDGSNPRTTERQKRAHVRSERQKRAHARSPSQTAQKRPRQVVRAFALSKELPNYFLLETASGYGLVVTHGLSSVVDGDYVSVEKYINRFDQNFNFVAFHHFGSTDEAFIELKSISKGDVTELLMNFLVQNLPKVANANGKPCFVLALADPRMAIPIGYKTRVCCLSSVFHNDIMRGVRMNIRKSIKPEVLWEKEQMDLVRLYNQHMPRLN